MCVDIYSSWSCSSPTMWDWSLTTDRRPPPSPTPARCRVDPEGEL